MENRICFWLVRYLLRRLVAQVGAWITYKHRVMLQRSVTLLNRLLDVRCGWIIEDICQWWMYCCCNGGKSFADVRFKCHFQCLIFGRRAHSLMIDLCCRTWRGRLPYALQHTSTFSKRHVLLLCLTNCVASVCLTSRALKCEFESQHLLSWPRAHIEYSTSQMVFCEWPNVDERSYLPIKGW